ncbi:MAG: hypothetical protein HY927_16470 [Elusimicrobia bacterium]|nr:hypothetical protein [Elusimicrobiota bacterium]
MATGALRLDFHGVRAALACDSPEILADLERDFAYFAATDRPGAEPDVSLTLRLAAPPPGRVPARAFLRWRGVRIAHERGRRLADYDGLALLDYDLEAEEGVLSSASRDLLRELGYLAVLSRVGEMLDRRRLHRVHALGFSYRGRGGLILLPMNGGKSRLALELVGRDGFELLSDDIPLLGDGGRTLSAFPLRMGLRGDDWRAVPERFVRPFRRRRFGVKHLVDLDFFRDRVRASSPLSWILLGARDGRRRPSLAPCSRGAAAAALLSAMVVGIGAPQVLELMLPAPPFVAGTLRLARIAAGRARTALAAAARASCGRFLLAEDCGANAEALKTFLDGERT